MVFLALLVLVALAAVVVVLVLGVRRTAKEHEAEKERIESPTTQTLEYVVPHGQDPVAVVDALRQAGYGAVVETDGGERLVLVPCPAGTDRERAHVRSIIADSPTTIQDGAPTGDVAVQFQDER